MPESEQSGLHGRSEIILSQFSAAEREAVLRDTTSLEALSALSSFSPALIQALAARVPLARWLFLERAFEKAAYLDNMSSELGAQAQKALGLEDLQAVLRAYRIKEMARLAVRDLTGRADLAEVMETLSELAEACLGTALQKASVLVADRFGLPPRRPGFKPVILGMGKLGGRELNYSSDIDLIYLYQPSVDVEERTPVEEAAAFLFTTITRALSEVTEDGLVFRVDLNLRPGGKDGAQAQSLESAYRHYLALGRPWERLALLKARPVAGDLRAGHEFLSELEPFIFRRHLDYTSLEELRDLKVRITREKRARMRRISGSGRSEPVIDVKLSPGGIREIEFFAQALLLTFGGRLPHLKRSTTLGALTALADETIISHEVRDQLSRAYIFLRTVEHRLQLRDLAQTQTVPRNESARAVLAAAMGGGLESRAEFSEALRGHMDRVAHQFNELLAEPGDVVEAGPAGGGDGLPDWVFELLDGLDDDESCLNILGRVGFRRPEAALAACREIRAERFLPDRLSRYGRQLDRLLPGMVAAVAGTLDPDRAVLYLARFMTSIGPRAGFFILLEENPRLVNLLSILFGSSEYLSEILVSHPAILDSLVDRRSGMALKDRETLSSELTTMIGREEDPESCLTVIRRFKNDETLRIGLYDLLDKLTLEEIQRQLTDLAEVVMERTLELATGLVMSGRGPSAPVPLMVLGLGKMGGRELFYASDLDIIFVLGEERGGPGLSLEEAVRLSQRFISYLSVYLDAGPGYEIDSRLRPSGMSGPLVVTLDSFTRYHQSSQLWERQALIKMRPIIGPRRLGKRIRSAVNETVYRRPLPDDAALSIDRIRKRMTEERARIKNGALNFKFSPGGLVDLEFVTQYLQMTLGRGRRGNIRSPRTLTGLGAMCRLGLGPAGLETAGRAYELLSRSACRLGLIYARSGDRAAYTPDEINHAAIPGAGENAWDTLTAAMNDIRGVYEEVFHGEGTGGG